ncbi:Os01g0824000, partial [Oryza sativa Japonica Group]
WWSPQTGRSTNNGDEVVEQGSSSHTGTRSPLNRSWQSSKQRTAQPEHSVRSAPAAAAAVDAVVNSSAAVFRYATHVSPSELKMPSPSRSRKTVRDAIWNMPIPPNTLLRGCRPEDDALLCDPAVRLPPTSESAVTRRGTRHGRGLAAATCARSSEDAAMLITPLKKMP